MAAISTSTSLRYPSAEARFSPSSNYPEYALGRISHFPNDVYAAVRSLFMDSGLDAARAGTPSWNPLGSYIPPGSSVFVLCNFVYQRKPRERLTDFRGKCVHGSVLRALIDYALIATGPTGRVRFGNAPLQACDWDSVIRDTEAQQVMDFYREVGANVEAQDLRLLVAEHTVMGRIVSRTVKDESGLATTIDLGNDSLLADLPPAADGHGAFRVSDYDPRITESFHRDGSHRYVVSQSVLSSDVVVSLSKMKTHNKVGITCGLKGFVGAVAHKHCLAHHRFGPPLTGGDEYSDKLAFLRPVSGFHDWVQRQDGHRRGIALVQIADRSAKRFLRQVGLDMAGSWYGNDTAWRMALDLSRILSYSDSSGRMRDQPQRRHLSLIDGIIAGEGEGPLAPSAVHGGALLFSDNVAIGDRIACRMMGLQPSRFPVVREAFTTKRYPIASEAGALTLLRGTETVPEQDITSIINRPFKLPRGWQGQPGADR